MLVLQIEAVHGGFTVLPPQVVPSVACLTPVKHERVFNTALGAIIVLKHYREQRLIFWWVRVAAVIIPRTYYTHDCRITLTR